LQCSLAIPEFMVLTLLLLAVPDTFACSFVLGDPHAITANPEDTTAPTAPADIEGRLHRGVGPTQGLFGASSSSCDDLGWIELELDVAVDDVSATENVGYQLRILDGSLPDGLQVEETRRIDFLNGDRGVLTLLWVDGATDEQESFDFTLGIAAVDEAGNVGEEVTVALADAGSDGRGCATTQGGGAIAVLAALALVARRRG
jgi:hypothetical protein